MIAGLLISASLGLGRVEPDALDLLVEIGVEEAAIERLGEVVAHGQVTNFQWSTANGMAKYNVTANAIMPGLIATPLVRSMPEHLRDAQWKVESTNLGRWDSPAGLVVNAGGTTIRGLVINRTNGDAITDPFGQPGFPAPRPATRLSG